MSIAATTRWHRRRCCVLQFVWRCGGCMGWFWVGQEGAVLRGATPPPLPPHTPHAGGVSHCDGASACQTLPHPQPPRPPRLDPSEACLPLARLIASAVPSVTVVPALLRPLCWLCPSPPPLPTPVSPCVLASWSRRARTPRSCSLGRQQLARKWSPRRAPRPPSRPRPRRTPCSPPPRGPSALVAPSGYVRATPDPRPTPTAPRCPHWSCPAFFHFAHCCSLGLPPAWLRPQAVHTATEGQPFAWNAGLAAAAVGGAVGVRQVPACCCYRSTSETLCMVINVASAGVGLLAASPWFGPCAECDDNFLT